MADGSSGRNQGDHTSIEMRNVVSSIEERFQNVSPSTFGETTCIFKVHEKFRKINEFAYAPEIVAIGPLHHGKRSLQFMEDHKVRYARSLLARTMQETELQEFVQAIKSLEEISRKCYSEPIKLKSEKFVEMMVVDGLFIIELFHKCRDKKDKEENDKDDPIFNTVWGLSSVIRDMILLENQLPMVVLESLFNQIKFPSQDGLSLTVLALQFFNLLMRRDDEVIKKYNDYKGKHLLDLLVHTIYPPSLTQMEWNPNPQLNFLPCVTELQRAGTKFKAIKTNTDSFLDLRFSNGVLEIPPIRIEDQTECFLRNLIASEQCSDGRATYITSYAFLMDSLIDSANDVRILREKGIIENYLGDDEVVSSLFNKLCNEVTLVNFCYPEICEEGNAYYKKWWHLWKATFRRNYLQSPWAICSFMAAILLLVLTITGTLFTILSFVYR